MSLLLSRRNGLIIPALDFNPAGGIVPAAFIDSRSSTAWGFNSSGILTPFGSNIARYVYDPSSLASLGFLSEQAHQNVLASSQDFTVWAGTPTGLTPNAGTSPDGTNDATQWAGTGRLFLQSVLGGNTTYNFALFIKAPSGSPSVTLQIKDINTDTIRGTTTVPATSAWTRINVSGTTAGATAGVRAEIGTTGTVLIWQADVIANAFPLSPVVTTGSSVNVLADNASIPLSALGIPGSPTGITIIGKAKAPIAPGAFSQTVIHINDGSTNNEFLVNRGTNGVVGAVINLGGAAQLNATLGSVADSANFSFWVSASNGNMAAQLVGGTKVTSTGSMPAGLTSVNIGSRVGGSAPLNSTISRLLIYNQRLSDAPAAAIAGRL